MFKITYLITVLLFIINCGERTKSTFTLKDTLSIGCRQAINYDSNGSNGSRESWGNCAPGPRLSRKDLQNSPFDTSHYNSAEYYEKELRELKAYNCKHFNEDCDETGGGNGSGQDKEGQPNERSSNHDDIIDDHDDVFQGDPSISDNGMGESVDSGELGAQFSKRMNKLSKQKKKVELLIKSKKGTYRRILEEYKAEKWQVEQNNTQLAQEQINLEESIARTRSDISSYGQFIKDETKLLTELNRTLQEQKTVREDFEKRIRDEKESNQEIMGKLREIANTPDFTRPKIVTPSFKSASTNVQVDTGTNNEPTRVFKRKKLIQKLIDSKLTVPKRLSGKSNDLDFSEEEHQLFTSYLLKSDPNHEVGRRVHKLKGDISNSKNKILPDRHLEYKRAKDMTIVADTLAAENKDKEANIFVDIGRFLVSLAVGIYPPSSFIQSFANLVEGKDVITGKELSSFEYSVEIVNLILLGFGGVVKTAGMATFKAGVQIAAVAGVSAAGAKMSKRLKDSGTMMVLGVKKVTDSVGEITKRLSPQKIRNYLSNVDNVPRKQLVSDMESIGLKLKGKGSPDGRFMEFVDSKGRLRAKIHPPDGSTKTNHLHIYDKEGNSLNKVLEKVKFTSPEAHIPIQ